jgi:hypothetical protein
MRLAAHTSGRRTEARTAFPTSLAAQPGVVFFSPCLFGPVGDLADRPLDFLAAALSETAPLECVFLPALVFPPLESLVD